jgi:hypothetical protein
VHEARQVALALHDLAVDRGQVAVQRAEPPEHLAQVARAVAQPLAGPADQELQVRARVGVERRQDLVRVHVRQRVPHGDQAALGHGRLRARARLEREEHVLQPRPGAQQHGRVAAHEVVVLAVEVKPHPRSAFVQLHLSHVADLHAGHPHRLPLARRDSLRVLEVHVDLVGLVLDQREAQPLVGEDVGAHARREGDHPHHGHEVAQMRLDRVPHSCSSGK